MAYVVYAVHRDRMLLLVPPETTEHEMVRMVTTKATGAPWNFMEVRPDYNAHRSAQIKYDLSRWAPKVGSKYSLQVVYSKRMAFCEKS